MSVRRFATYLTGVLIAASAAMFGAAAPAMAATTSPFIVEFYHSNGTRTSTISGTARWLNRSVNLVDIKQTVRSGECSLLWVNAYIPSDNEPLMRRSSASRCSGSFDLGEILLNPADATPSYDGAITKVEVFVVDSTHGSPRGEGLSQFLSRT